MASITSLSRVRFSRPRWQAWGQRVASALLILTITMSCQTDEDECFYSSIDSTELPAEATVGTVKFQIDHHAFNCGMAYCRSSEERDGKKITIAMFNKTYKEDCDFNHWSSFRTTYEFNAAEPGTYYFQFVVFDKPTRRYLLDTLIVR